jgi:hypothetical protein
MKQKNLLLAFALLLSIGLFAQEKFPPEQVIVGHFVGETMPLRDFPTSNGNFNPESVITVPNISTTEQQINDNPPPVIPNLQTAFGGIVALPIDQNFIGASSFESPYYPPDPTGAVGPDHYVHSVNSLVKIFDKSGNLLAGPTTLGDFLGFGGNSGDPIVLYDQLADRWLVSEFGSINGGNSLAVGVSTTNDPTGTYNVYQYAFPGFPDYPHYGVWPDAYYGTVNLNGQTTRAFAMDRTKILAGDPNPEIQIFSLPGIIVNPNQVKSPEPANLLGTDIAANTPGYITYLQDDAWSGVSNDHLKIWEIDVDFVTPSNSTVSAPLEIATDPFDAGELFGQGAIDQPGTSQNLAGHGGIISFGANYRSFTDHNSWVITFNTFVDANDRGGIRWIELRNNSSNPWTLYQEGTYAPTDDNSRFMSSSSMDIYGNIALAFSIGGPNLPVGIRYTGRYASDPLGQMTVAETTIVDGVGVRTNSYRYGDYSHMSMDTDGFTFWHTADFFSSNNAWRTQIASFTLGGGFNDDVGISAIPQPENGILTNSETVEVEIHNFGTDAQSNIPLELRIDGSLEASETFTGTVAAGAVVNYSFVQQVDLSNAGHTYSIEAKTNLSGDEFVNNDAFTKEVLSLLSTDAGPVAITAPVTGPGLGMETISATIKNFGSNPISNFDVQYVIDGGAPVVETYTGTINSGQEVSYDFAQQADFSAVQVHNVTVTTLLSGDQASANDSFSEAIENQFCQPSIDCSGGNGIRLFSIAEINNPSDCEGYADNTAMVANLAPGSTNDLTITTHRGRQYITVWIDFNDDFVFTADEVVVDNYQVAPGQGAGTFTETMDLVVPANAPDGMHIMRAKANYNAPVPADACAITNRGEVEDYTANIGELGVDDLAIRNSKLVITSKDNKHFEVSLVSNYDGLAYVSIFNVLGQELGVKLVGKEDDSHKVEIDMSNAASGVYLVKAGGQFTKTSITGRIVVK